MSNLLRTVVFASTGVALFSSPAMAAAPWSAPQTVDASASAAQVIDPLIESDANRNLTAAWIGGATDRGVFVATKPLGGSWSAPQRLSEGLPPGITDLTLDVNGAGAATLSWNERRSYHQTELVTASRSGAASAWQAPQSVRPEFGGSLVPWTIASSTALQESGGALTVLNRRVQEFLNGTFRYYDFSSSYRPAGGSWTADATSPEWNRPALGIVGEGDGTALLIDVSATGELLAYTHPTGGVWSAPQVIASGVAGLASGGAPLQLATSRGGQAVAAFTTETDAGSELRIVRRGADGAWAAPETLAQQPSSAGPGDGLYDPRVALDGAGRTTATWTRFTSTATEYRTTLESTTAPATSAFPPATTLASWDKPIGEGSVVPGFQDPDLSVSAYGLALLTWRKGAEVQAVSRSSSSAAWSAVQSVGTGSEGSTREVDSFVGEDGLATVLLASADKLSTFSANVAPVVEPPKGRVITVNATMMSWTGRCPSTVSASANGRSAKLGVRVPDSSGRHYRCYAFGDIPQSASAKLGSTALVVANGGGLLPYITVSRVTAAS